MARISWAGSAIAGVLVSHQAQAGGLVLPGYGSQSQARAGAFTAKVDDPTALFMNPAGLAKTVGTMVYVGSNLLRFRQSYQRFGRYELSIDAKPYQGQEYPEVNNDTSQSLGLGSWKALPALAVSSDLGLAVPLRFGVGLFVPNVYPDRDFSSSYQIEQDPNQPPPPQRYDVIEQKAVVLYPSLGASYRITDNLDVGARVTWGTFSFEGRTSTWASRNLLEQEANDATFAVDVKDSFVPVVAFGLLFRPSPAFEFGGAYETHKKTNARGSGRAVLGSGASEFLEALDPVTENPRCAPGGTALELKACLNWTPIPQMARLGARWIGRDGQGRERYDVEFDVVWEDWSSASDAVLVVDGRTPIGNLFDAVVRHGFQDTWSLRLGGAYRQPLVGANDLWFRGGIAHDTAAAPNSWTRLDIDGVERTTLALGIAFEADDYRIDLGAGLVVEPTRQVNDDCNPTINALGCDGTGLETAVSDRDRPDPVQPIFSPGLQAQSPFNAGRYEQGYLQMSLGVTKWF